MKVLNPGQHILCLNSLRYLVPYGLGGAVNKPVEEEDATKQLMTTVFVEHPLAVPSSIKYI